MAVRVSTPGGSILKGHSIRKFGTTALWTLLCALLFSNGIQLVWKW